MIFCCNWEIFSANWEKSHLNSIGKGAEFRPLRHPKKIPVVSYFNQTDITHEWEIT